jgi:CBS domain-containing protein
MKVGELVKSKGYGVISVDSDTTLTDAIVLMNDRNIGALLIVDHGKPSGIFTERDVVRHVASATDLNITPIKDVMCKDLIAIEPDEDLDNAMSIMTQKGVRHLPVVDGGAVVSVLSIRDLVKVMVRNLKAEVHYLKDYLEDFN